MTQLLDGLSTWSAHVLGVEELILVLLGVVVVLLVILSAILTRIEHQIEYQTHVIASRPIYPPR